MNANRPPGDAVAAAAEELRRMSATPDDMCLARMGARIEAGLDTNARTPRRGWARARTRAAVLAFAMLGVGAAAGATIAVRSRDRARTGPAPARVEPAPMPAARRAAARAAADVVPDAPPSPPVAAPPPSRPPARANAHVSPSRAEPDSPRAPRDEVAAGYAAAEQLMRVGATVEARAALLDLVARHSDDPRVEPALIDLARLSASAGKRNAARGFLREYLRRYPRGTFATQAAARLRALD